jgi:hypothetical protein
MLPWRILETFEWKLKDRRDVGGENGKFGRKFVLIKHQISHLHASQLCGTKWSALFRFFSISSGSCTLVTSMAKPRLRKGRSQIFTANLTSISIQPW